jgi:Zn-dependent peptidase ImmA (M78 family)
MAAIDRAIILARKTLQGYPSIKGAVPVEKIAKDHGIEIKHLDLSSDVSGAMKREGKSGKPIIIVNGTHSDVRQRFTIAHELGHFLLHAMSPQYIDKQKVYFRDNDSSTGEDIIEVQANQFAAELLMPINSLKKDFFENSKLIEGDDPKKLIEKLAEKYKVSEQAMSIRISKFMY